MMADGTDSNEFLLKEIQRLEKEKEELERRNRERQLLEQRLKDLKGTVSSLRAGDGEPLQTSQSQRSGKSALTSPKTGRGSEAVENDEDLEARLQESRAQIQFLQSQLHGSPSPRGQRSRAKDTERTSDSSSDDEEDVMSTRHKQVIQANRDILVENMIPDDIFNDLISKKILTTADVSRIKERNTREAINEELLNNLCRRSDRAFHVFVQSLRKTLQEYLANRIDPPTSGRSRKKKRKRQTGEVNISVDCDEVEPLSTSSRRGQRGASTSNSGASFRAQCSCQEVEEQILLMAKDAFRNIRRRDATPAAFEQFRKELQQTNAIIKDSMEIMHTLKILCRHGDVTGVSEGSVVFSIRCHSSAAVRELWAMYTSGTLLTLIQQGFVTRTLKKKCRARRIKLKVWISYKEYLSCLRELERRERMSDSADVHTVISKSLHQMKKRKCQEENCFGVHLKETPAPRAHGAKMRRVFQEIGWNRNVDHSVLPSKEVHNHSCQTPAFQCRSTHKPLGASKSRSPPCYNLRLRFGVHLKETPAPRAHGAKMRRVFQEIGWNRNVDHSVLPSKEVHNHHCQTPAFQCRSTHKPLGASKSRSPPCYNLRLRPL